MDLERLILENLDKIGKYYLVFFLGFVLGAYWIIRMQGLPAPPEENVLVDNLDNFIIPETP